MINQMKLVKVIVFSAAVIISALSCTKDFSELNTDKNVPTSVTPDLLLSGVQRSMMSDMVGNAWGIGNIVVQYHAKIQFVNEDRYLWNEKNGVWNSVYNNYRNLQNILSQVGDDDKNAYNGIALVMKSWMFSLVTDAYGDVPYSEAGKAKTDGLYTPKYDKQEDIYKGLLADLKKANEILARSTNTVTGDIIYSGNILRWRRLANSLRIRLLMRLSKKQNVSADMQAIIADPTNNPIMAGNADNAELRYLTQAPNEWPLYGNRVGSFDEFRVSKTLSDRLTALGDKRLAVFGRPSQRSVALGSPVIEGIPNGLGDVQALNYNGGPQGVSRVGYTFACLVCNDPGQAAPDPSAPRSILMSYSELQFLLAEARERDFISTGSAEAYYLEGIRSNFAYWKAVVPASYGIDLTIPDSYYTQTAVAYSGTSDEKLDKIYLQKWISLYFTGLEAWFDWRRTRKPAIVPGANNLNENKVPVRFIYPVSEQSLNQANRAEAVTRQGGTDDINTLVWIAK
jgi:hypothetical protein